MIYIQLLENMALIALFAYIYNRSNTLKKLIKDNFKIRNKILMIAFFSILGIIGNYTGVNVGPSYESNGTSILSGYIRVHDAIANTRPIASIVSGYIYGPLVGIVVGLISGTHRYFLGGSTALACGISTVVEGIIGGVAGKKFRNTNLNVKYACATAITAECVQMIIILVFSSSVSTAVHLVKIIAIPMILINSLGTVIFISIIKSSKEEFNRIGAIEAQKALNIAQKTLSYMRKGLNIKTAKNISQIIYEMTNIDGIFIGDKEGFLTCLGEDIDEKNIKNFLREYYKSPNYKIIKIDNIFFICEPLNIVNSGFEGVIALGFNSKKNITIYFEQFAEELRDLLSNQIELYKLNKLAEEASTAKFRALQAQIEPHFLFNALNTISSFCRTNPLKARELIIDLSNYFRKTLKTREDFIYLKDELEFIQSYFSIEKARFGNRLALTIDIPEKLMNTKVPSYILQPIIENSVKHGILPSPEGGIVYLKVISKNNKIRFSIEDTGVGMSQERLKDVLANWPGIGLKNVNERLKLLYGEDHGLNIKTSLNKGTKISFLVPMKEGSSVNV